MLVKRGEAARRGEAAGSRRAAGTAPVFSILGAPGLGSKDVA